MSLRIGLSTLNLFCIVGILACHRIESPPNPSLTQAPPPASVPIADEVAETETPTTSEAESDRTEKPIVTAKSDEELLAERRKQILDSVWASPLGQMLSEFLFDLQDDSSDAPRAKAIAQRIFADEKQTLTYLSAVHLMTQDLFDRRLIDDSRQKRLLMLQGEMNHKQTQAPPPQPTTGLSEYALYAVLAALPFGSPQVRYLFGFLINRFGIRADRLLPWLGMSRLFKSSVKPKSSDFALFEIVKKFEPTYPFKQFFTVMGPLTLMYFYYYDYKQQQKGTPIDQNMTPLMRDERQFLDLLRQLSNL